MSKHRRIESPEINSCSTATRRIKYLGINLHNEAKDLYTKNYKQLMKEIEDSIKTDRKIYCVLGLEEYILLNDYS